MCLTAHYVDKQWKLRKKILIFRYVLTPHTGTFLGDYLIKFLVEWGIDKKVFSITLDNASNNEGMVRGLKGYLRETKSLISEGEFLHVRCAAHVLNLIVQDGLKSINVPLSKIRECVKYVKGSPSRKQIFAKCASLAGLKSDLKLQQDVITRWNSTYLMLESALKYRMAFFHLQAEASMFKAFNIFPTRTEWTHIEKLTEMLAPFYEITTLFSGASYPTANLYFPNVRKIQQLIATNLKSDDKFIHNMATQMALKFEKYWECYSVVLSIAIILDPRYKLEHVKAVFEFLDPDTAETKWKNVDVKLKNLFNEYMQMHLITPHRTSTSSSDSDVLDECQRRLDKIDLEFNQYESQRNAPSNLSQLDAYLKEIVLPRDQKLDVLEYWKTNRKKWPALSQMARDVLSIPITTVASESAFSFGGWILDPFRSTTSPKMVEARVCTRDWLFGCTVHKDKEDVYEDDEDDSLTEIQIWTSQQNIGDATL